MVFPALGSIGSWLLGMYAERQDNLGTEERPRNIESNREKNYCFGVQKINVLEYKVCVQAWPA